MTKIELTNEKELKEYINTTSWGEDGPFSFKFEYSVTDYSDLQEKEGVDGARCKIMELCMRDLESRTLFPEYSDLTFSIFYAPFSTSIVIHIIVFEIYN